MAVVQRSLLVIDINSEKNKKVSHNEDGTLWRVAKRSGIALAIIGPVISIWVINMRDYEIFNMLPDTQSWIFKTFLSIFWALFLIILYFDDRISSIKKKGFVGLTYIAWVLVVMILIMVIVMLLISIIGPFN